MGETCVAYPVSPGKGRIKMEGTAAVSLGAHLNNALQMPALATLSPFSQTLFDSA